PCCTRLMRARPATFSSNPEVPRISESTCPESLKLSVWSKSLASRYGLRTVSGPVMVPLIFFVRPGQAIRPTHRSNTIHLLGECLDTNELSAENRRGEASRRLVVS